MSLVELSRKGILFLFMETDLFFCRIKKNEKKDTMTIRDGQLRRHT